MANDFGKMGDFSVVSRLISEVAEEALAPISIFLDATGDIANFGDSVTVHLYNSSTSPATQVASGGVALDYTAANVTSDIDLTPVTVVLDTYRPEGFSIPENLLARSPAKDLVTKFAGKKVHALAKGMIQDVYTAIDSSFTNTVNVSAGYDWAKHNDVLEAAADLELDPSETVLVLNNKRFYELVESLPSLGGVQVNEILKTGVVQELGGIKSIIRSAVVPSGTNGFLTTRDAVAVAMRPLPALDGAMSYGRSAVESAPSGVSLRTRVYQDPDAPNHQMRIDTIYGYKAFNKDALIRLV